MLTENSKLRETIKNEHAKGRFQKDTFVPIIVVIKN